jgi:uncharacterized protein (TIGR03083 family)
VNSSVADPGPWLRALRASHDRLARLAGGLDGTDLRRQSYDRDWSIAQVLSHLGSQAEIFGFFLDAGLTGGESPSPSVFGPIWDVWNARSPEEQAVESIAADEALLSRVESLGPAQLGSFRVSAFGRELDMAAVLAMRLSEHAVHTWDVAVALDATARISQDAVAPVHPRYGRRAAGAGRDAVGELPRPHRRGAGAARVRPSRRVVAGLG